jgi:rSAM/selenodomain-associated transferase 1
MIKTVTSSKTLGDTALIIFVKNPKLGTVKTRIAKDAGDEKALEIYKRLLKHTREQCNLIDCRRYLFYGSEIIDDEWSTDQYIKKEQRGADLGERMMEAFIEVLTVHKKAIIIGSDCIYLDAPIIRQAIEALDNHDKVIGPTYDGGYYLLGMKDLQLDLFLNVPWSSGKEYGITKERILNVGSSLSELEKLNDIDYLKDWEEYLRSTPGV